MWAQETVNLCGDQCAGSQMSNPASVEGGAEGHPRSSRLSVRGAEVDRRHLILESQGGNNGSKLEAEAPDP